jgi:hypothetical protein
MIIPFPRINHRLNMQLIASFRSEQMPYVDWAWYLDHIPGLETDYLLYLGNSKKNRRRYETI